MAMPANQQNILAGASAKIGFKMNLDKRNVMVFRKGRHFAAPEEWEVKGQSAGVNSYVYHG